MNKIRNSLKAANNMRGKSVETNIAYGEAGYWMLLQMIKNNIYNILLTNQ